MKRRRVVAAFGAAASALALPAWAQEEPKVLRFSWWGGGGRHEATLKAVRLFEQHKKTLSPFCNQFFSDKTKMFSE